jgi:hypothetical protein
MKKIGLIFTIAIGLAACNSKDTAQPTTQTIAPPTGTYYLPLTVVVNQNQPGYVIPPTFEGLSYEIGILTKTPGFLVASNTVLVQMVKNLGNGILRLGGNSSDETLWTGQTRKATTGTDSLTTTDVDNVSAFAKAIGWQVLYGFNLGTYNPAVAANEAQYVNNSFQNSLYAFQTGNEPDLYKNNGHRTASYAYTNYQQEWAAYSSAVKNVLPNAPFAGPDVASSTSWITSFADNENTNVKLIDGHYYVTGPGTDPSITYQTILAPNTKLPTYLQVLNTSSLKYHLPYRVSECNSIYSGGKTGVSDVFASALWALDFMWTVAENNGQGINFHGGSSGAYSPVAIDNGILTARPMYYGMLAFKYGTAGGTIVPATISQTQYNCSAYACTNAGTTYLTLINKDSGLNFAFTVQLSNTASNVTIARLTAPAITSTTGVTFAGSTVSTTDGTFKATTTEQQTVNQKSFVVNVPAGSAAIITIQ